MSTAPAGSLIPQKPETGASSAAVTRRYPNRRRSISFRGRGGSAADVAEGYEKKVRALQRNIDSLGKQVYALQAQNVKLRSGGAAQGALEVDGEASAVRFAEELRSLRNFSDKRALADEKRINDLGTEKRELQRQLGASETEAARWKEKCLSIEKKLAFANEALVKLACERDGIAYNANMSRMQHRDELASLESRLENAEHDNGELR